MDGETVEAGSFKYTAAASSRNAENVLVVHDAVLAARYTKEWERALEGIRGIETPVLTLCLRDKTLLGSVNADTQDFQERPGCFR